MKKKYLLTILAILFIILVGIISLLYFKTDVLKHFFEKQETDLPVNQTQMTEEEIKLQEIGYNELEREKIYEYMSEKNQKELLNHPYVDLTDFYEIPNFELKNIDRYLAYQTISHLELQDCVTQVNLNLDKPFYEEIEEIEDPSSITVLVNKYHALPATYEPDLIPIPSFPNLKLREEAAYALEKLIAAAKENGSILIPYSTYRSYEYQDGLYQKYLQNDPVDVVDTYSARPGHSEHQTGLAVDIRSEEHWSNLTEKDYAWMKENSYQYGFIIRYTKDNNKITGYKEEPWHIRYIGIEHATKVHELNITYDEYYDLYLTNH